MAVDPVKNPYSSGQSVPPPLLAGRDAVLEHARLLLGRLKSGLAEKGLLLTGPRGSGKTVLLQALAQLAQAQGGHAAFFRTQPGQTFAAALDTALAETAAPALLLVDDAQAWNPDEIRALIQAQETLLRTKAPRSLVLAGIPFQEQLADAIHALAGHVFESFTLQALDPADAAAALQTPAQAAGASIEPEALRELLRLSKAHPAFLQAWAYQAWNRAAGAAITAADVRQAAPAVTARLDRDFYGPGYDRLSPRERNYLRSMAHLGPGPHRSGDVADSMDAKITSLGPLRAKLIRKGWVYSPGHGLMGFSAPGLDEFMRRVMPNFR